MNKALSGSLAMPIIVALAVILAGQSAAQALPPCSLEAGFRATCLDRDGTVYVMPQIPDEDLKRAALLLGYQMNGNSMVRYGDSIDLTAPVSSFMRTLPPKPRR